MIYRGAQKAQAKFDKHNTPYTIDQYSFDNLSKALISSNCPTMLLLRHVEYFNDLE